MNQCQRTRENHFKCNGKECDYAEIVTKVCRWNISGKCLSYDAILAGHGHQMGPNGYRFFKIWESEQHSQKQ